MTEIRCWLCGAEAAAIEVSTHEDLARVPRARSCRVAGWRRPRTTTSTQSSRLRPASYSRPGRTFSTER